MRLRKRQGRGRPAVERLGNAVRAPDVAERLLKIGFEPVGSSSGELARRMAEDRARWAPIVKASGFSADQYERSPGVRPNFVFILADDLGYADLGCYGGRSRCSPELDRMAAEGLRFTQRLLELPVCSPTRFALMTGRWQYRLRGGNDEPIASRHRGDPVLGIAARTSDARIAAARRGLRHGARRQMAPRVSAAFRPVEERLPGILRRR
jgi:hypothetical protein